MKTLAELHQIIYGERAEQWKDEKDDRKLFSNMYYLILEGLQALEGIDNTFVRSAVLTKYREDRATMDRIAERFVQRQEA